MAALTVTLAAAPLLSGNGLAGSSAKNMQLTVVPGSGTPLTSASVIPAQASPALAPTRQMTTSGGGVGGGSNFYWG